MRHRVVLVPGVRVLRMRARLLLEPRRHEQPQHTVIRTMSTIPPTYSASVNCQPSRIQRTRPSSQTRFVEANWKASAEAADAPFWKSDFAIAIAA